MDFVDTWTDVRRGLKPYTDFLPFYHFRNNLIIGCGCYDIQWITSCCKNCMTTGVITLWCIHVTSLTVSVLTMSFLIEIMFILNVIKSHFKGSYDKQNLTLVAISYEIYETCQCEMTMCVRSSNMSERRG